MNTKVEPQLIGYSMPRHQAQCRYFVAFEPGVFSFPLAKVVLLMRLDIRREKDLINAGITRKGTFAFKQFEAELALLEEFEQQLARNSDVDWNQENQLFAGAFVSEALERKDFSDAFCPLCRQSYIPGELSVETWETRSGKNGEGGRMFKCPMAHVLYIGIDWVEC